MLDLSKSVEQLDHELIQRYIHGCHILHYHGIVDAYGHLSFRISESVFMMCRYMAPALVSGTADIVLYSVNDGEALHKDAPKGWFNIARLTRSVSQFRILTTMRP
jgi:hypothetical protein